MVFNSKKFDSLQEHVNELLSKIDKNNEQIETNQKHINLIKNKILEEIPLLINYAPHDDNKNSLSYYISIILIAINNIKNEQNKFKSYIKNDINCLKNDINGLKNDINCLKNDINGLKNDIDNKQNIKKSYLNMLYNYLINIFLNKNDNNEEYISITENTDNTKYSTFNSSD